MALAPALYHISYHDSGLTGVSGAMTVSSFWMGKRQAGGGDVTFSLHDASTRELVTLIYRLPRPARSSEATRTTPSALESHSRTISSAMTAWKRCAPAYSTFGEEAD